ncbi:hypothetical protein Aple_038690 [Acrocarpospora pleiomorpha]|uniref:Uncharacterized protein n=1 Tax=Acrocarpospora pleiomorpha TaxID=90975 RepID=A0A5M3XP98_9ACTN|nr:hypothetical protein Aple_038690 [Acrocarpospora pleiomorpha]
MAHEVLPPHSPMMPGTPLRTAAAMTDSLTRAFAVCRDPSMETKVTVGTVTVLSRSETIWLMD